MRYIRHNVFTKVTRSKNHQKLEQCYSVLLIKHNLSNQSSYKENFILFFKITMYFTPELVRKIQIPFRVVATNFTRPEAACAFSFR